MLGVVFFWFDAAFTRLADFLLGVVLLCFVRECPAEHDIMNLLVSDAAEYEHLITRDYCHDLNNFTLSDAQIKAQNGGANPHCMGELASYLQSTLAIFTLSTIAAMLLVSFATRIRTRRSRTITYARPNWTSGLVSWTRALSRLFS